MAHIHRWIDITTLDSDCERRKCGGCGLEQRRPFIDIMEGPHLDNDGEADWEDDPR